MYLYIYLVCFEEQVRTNLLDSSLVAHQSSGEIFCFVLFFEKTNTWGFSWWLSGEESTCRCRGHGFAPW